MNVIHLSVSLQIKCSEYWPVVGQTVTYGHVTVTSQEVEERAHFVIRTFLLKITGVKELRQHMHSL